MVSVDVPTDVAVSVLTSYFQGQGAIRTVVAIVTLDAMGSIPLQIVLAYYLSIEGAMLSIVLINAVIILLLLGYGYHGSDPPRVLLG